MTETIAQPPDTAHRRDEVVSWAQSLLVIVNIMLAFWFCIALSYLYTNVIEQFYIRGSWATVDLAFYLLYIVVAIWVLSMLTTLVLGIVGLRRVYRQGNHRDMVRAWVVLIISSLQLIIIVSIICYFFIANQIW